VVQYGHLAVAIAILLENFGVPLCGTPCCPSPWSLFADQQAPSWIRGKFFNKHGGSVVVIARFFEGMRQLNGLVAGIAQMA
jgi:hypothetical protein